MATVTNEQGDFNTLAGGVTFYLKTFGPSAFGVLTLILIWQFIVAPQLEASKLNFDKLEQISEQKRQLIVKMLEVSQSLERTANTMQQTTIKLDDIVERVARTQ